MNLDKFTRLLPKLRIEDKQTKAIVPFRVNESQRAVISSLKEMKEAGRPLWFIGLKARQIGFSTLSEALLFAHCISKPNANAMILAHQFASSRELFTMTKRFKDSLPVELPLGTQREMAFPHSGGMSTLKVATAGSRTGGRGMALTAIHFSEAAYYGSEGDIFISLLQAVQYVKDTIVVVESTANGREGEGEAFYQMWQRAIQGVSNFRPIFIPWTMDTSYVYDESLFDEPEDDEEQELVDMGLSRGQLAWRRWAIENKCQGSIEKFHQEYPINWNQAFMSSGSPAFETKELNWARKCVREYGKKVSYIAFERDLSEGRAGLKFKPDTKNGVAIFEKPTKTHRYYIGADVGRGSDG